MDLQIVNFRTKKSNVGFVAQFDAKFAEGITIRDLVLLRPKDEQGIVRVITPETARFRRVAVMMREDVRRQIGERAAAMYSSSMGRDVKYAPPIPKDDAGLRRILCAENEALERAGI